MSHKATCAWISMNGLLALPAFACPMCESPTAERVRAGLMTTATDGLTIPGLLLPFIVMALAVVSIQTDWSEMIVPKNKRQKLKTQKDRNSHD